MKITFHLAAVKQTKASEYAIRFLFGGIVTMLAGWVAKTYGPVIGGLFLAFPAIFPASMTLVEKHEEKKEQQANQPGKKRGIDAAAVDAGGAALGSLGLLAFAACVVWLPFSLSTGLMLTTALLAWLVVSGILWVIRQKI